MDFRLKVNKTMMVAGPSHAGKTVLVLNLLDKRHEIFDASFERVIWCYGVYQPSLLQQLQQRNITPHEGILASSDLQPYSMIVLDDLLKESKDSKEVTDLFTRDAHHKNCFIIFITQNLFPPGKESRTRSLNTHYLVIFKNPRDKSQFEILARQIEPRRIKALTDIFREATAKPHGYLFIDFTQECPEDFRFRTGILKNRFKLFKL